MSTPVATEKETYFSHKDSTEQFLSACQGSIETIKFHLYNGTIVGVADFVGFLGKAYAPVKSDISGNVNKVRTKYETNKEQMKYVQLLVDTDLVEHNGQLGIASEGLLWLKRGLEFMLELLKLLVKEYKESAANRQKTENMSKILREAYEKTLKRHHNFMSKQLFKIVIHAAPYRKDLLKALAYGSDGLEEICVDHIAELLDNFESNVNALVNFYYVKKLETRPA